MRLLLVVFLFCISIASQAEEMRCDQDVLAAVHSAAVQGEPNSQLLMGFLYELGYGVPQNFGKAAAWYSRAVQSGSESGLRRLGILTFFGQGVPKDEMFGALLVLLGPHDDFLPNIPPAERAAIENLRSIWRERQLEHRLESRIAQSWGPLRKSPSSNEFQTSIVLVSDRPDPADANERIYGPGTGDWNTGVSKSEYERMQKDCQDLIAQINGFQDWANERKIQDLRTQIGRMQAEGDKLKNAALKELLFAVGNALAAGGLALELPPVALFEAFRAVEGFKEAAERYVEAIDVEKDARKLLDMERSLERARSFGGRE